MNTYAQTTAARMAIAFMEQNGGQWPSDWSELWATRENQDFAGEYLIHSFDEMRPYASFDFSFRPDVAFFELDPHDTSPRFRVITSHDRLKGDFVWGEPNQLIFEYLKDEYANHL